MTPTRTVPDEKYLKAQTEAIAETLRLLTRLQGALNTGVRCGTGFSEAQSLVADIKDAMSGITVPYQDPFDHDWVVPL